MAKLTKTRVMAIINKTYIRHGEINSATILYTTYIQQSRIGYPEDRL